MTVACTVCFSMSRQRTRLDVDGPTRRVGAAEKGVGTASGGRGAKVVRDGAIADLWAWRPEVELEKRSVCAVHADGPCG